MSMSFAFFIFSFSSYHTLSLFLHDLGFFVSSFQDAASYRNVAFLAAVNALEEASAAEGVIQCMRYALC